MIDCPAIRARYKAGDPLHEIAADFGITVYAVLAIVGLEL